MLKTYRTEDDSCHVAEDEGALADLGRAVWIDLVDPTPEQEHAVEAVVDADIPTRAEMAEIEASSRLYLERGAAVMTLPVLMNRNVSYPETVDVTFVLTARQLVTIRYAEPSAFATFSATLRRTPQVCEGPQGAFAALLDAIVDRLADVLEDSGRALDAVGRAAFTGQAQPPGALRETMQQLGRHGEVVSKARESLVAMARLAAFARQLAPIRDTPEAAEQLALVATDVDVLLEHATSLAGKITFFLDTMLGMINIEQNAIIKTFSVVAVVFLPPTLIASIYGMNFEVMPELGWRFGYPMALLAMVASMIAPYAFFKTKGWI